MDNSNELKSIWSKGFQVCEPNLLPQRIEEIKAGESQNLIEKVKRTARADQRALPFVALLVIVGMLWFGSYKFAIFLTGVFAALYFYNESMLKKMEQVELKDSVLKYLTDFRTMTRKMVQHYTKVAGFGTLLIGLPVFLFALDVAGIPMKAFLEPEKKQLALTILFIGCILFSGFSMLAYRLSIKVLYGKKLKQIDEMIAALKRKV